jgi:hypothetical protein
LGFYLNAAGLEYSTHSDAFRNILLSDSILFDGCTDLMRLNLFPSIGPLLPHRNRRRC